MELETNALEVHINPKVWLPAEKAAWPSARQAVTFYYGIPRTETGCAQLNSDFFSSIYDNAATPSLRIGEACGKYVVVFRDDDFVRAAGTEGIRFMAEHESFHLAVQVYGSSVPLEYLQNSRKEVDGRAKDFFLKLGYVFNLNSGVHKAPSRAEMCKHFAANYLNLSEVHKKSIDSLVFWEWPAEYYAYKVMLRQGKLTEKSYSRMRRLAGSYEEYSLGVSVGFALDDILGPENWQGRVSRGESMLDIIGTWCSADYVPLPRTSVRVKSMQLVPN